MPHIEIAKPRASFKKILTIPDLWETQFSAHWLISDWDVPTLSGDTTRARSAYKDFLALWKDADPDIPILTEAKAKYAKLQ